MTTELFWLTLTVTMTALFWMPYIVNRMLELGVGGTLANPTYGDSAKAAWAQRMGQAHTNAVENLVLFAPLVLILAVAEVSTPVTVAACQLYFFARLVHFVVYSLGIPFVRTVSFLAGFVAQMTLVLTVFGAAG